jgi:uncharacterized protein (DUF58 family)
VPITRSTGIEHVWLAEPKYTLTAGVVVDLSPSLFYGTGHGEKVETAIDAAYASIWLTSRHGNRCGLVTVAGRQPKYLRHSQGTQHVQRCRAVLSAVRTEDGITTDLSAGLRTFLREFKQRGLCVVVSDFLQPGWEAALAEVARKHTVICFQVLDKREFEIEDIGLVSLYDPVKMEDIEVDTSDSEFRKDFAKAASVEQDRIRQAIVQAGARHEELWTHQDWAESIYQFFSRKRQKGRVGR